MWQTCKLLPHVSKLAGLNVWKVLKVESCDIEGDKCGDVELKVAKFAEVVKVVKVNKERKEFGGVEEGKKRYWDSTRVGEEKAEALSYQKLEFLEGEVMMVKRPRNDTRIKHRVL